MKKFFLLLFAILIAFAIYFSLSGNEGSLSGELEKFQVKDTSEITKIRILDKSDTLVLHRTTRSWKINNKFIASPEAIYHALKVFNQFEIQSPVPNSLVDSIVRNLETNFLQVEIYSSSTKVKNFKISQLEDKLGSFALAENSNNPMILYVPGMNLDLASYFSINPTFWRTKIVFDYNPNEIKSVRVTYPSEKEKSFLIENEEKLILKGVDNQTLMGYSAEKLINYLSLFRGIEYKKLLLSQKIAKDSILKEIPKIIFEITDMQNQKNTLKLYEKFSNNKLDFNLIYGFQDDKTFFEITYYSLDPVLKERDYFLN